MSSDNPSRAPRTSRPGGSDPVRRRASEAPSVPRPRRRRRTEVHLLWLAIGGVMTVALLIWMGVGENTPQPTVPIAPTATGVTQRVPAEPDTAATEAPKKAKRTVIVLAGTGTYGCYVEVRGKNAKGRLVVQRILAPGDSVTFRVVEGVWVRATNPAELAVTLDGRSTTLGSSESGVWRITANGVKSVG